MITTLIRASPLFRPRITSHHRSSLTHCLPNQRTPVWLEANLFHRFSFSERLQRRSMSPSSPPPSSVHIFVGKSVTDLDSWLQTHGIDTSLYGIGASKSVEMLLEEVIQGETSLLTSPSGAAQRSVSVVNVRLRNPHGYVLIEAGQILPSGTHRPRNLPLSEKMLPDEAWKAAAVRGVFEELGTLLSDTTEVVLDEASYAKTEETKESQSYPQLKTNVRIIFITRAHVPSVFTLLTYSSICLYFCSIYAIEWMLECKDSQRETSSPQKNEVMVYCNMYGSGER